MIGKSTIICFTKEQIEGVVQLKVLNILYTY